NGKRSGDAQMRAIEANAAAQAATAKARWLSTNAAIRTLQEDITRFGGTANVALVDEPSGQEINRGATTQDHIAAAQAAIDQARGAGAEQLVADANLKFASDMLDSARKVARASSSSDVADSLAYRAEMLGRRAYYLARFTDASRRMPDLQLQRTRLAQSASERSAAAEDAHIALRTAQERERLAQEAMNAEVQRMRSDLDAAQRTNALTPQLLATRQADLISRQQELEQFRQDYQAALNARVNAERAQEA